MPPKLILGLGNPGAEYERTRHNAGWMALDELAAQLELSWTKDNPRHAWIAKGVLDGNSVILAKPSTYMNDSGKALVALLSYYKDISPTDLLVVHDELDLAPGSLKFSEKAGSGGHNGIKSIFEESNNTEIPRLRIGIGRPPVSGAPVDGWVLGQAESETVSCAKTQAIQALKDWITLGLTKSMNMWNSGE